jgi:hypothetical protein
MLEEALDAALKQTKTSSEPQPLRLIFLGRVADYPWLSQGLSDWAKQSPDWDSVKGHAVAGGPSDNAVVANMLTQMAMADQGALSFLLTLLSRHGFRFSGASVEKVMAGPGGQYGTTPVVEPVLPYDALVHLRIGKIR